MVTPLPAEAAVRASRITDSTALIDDDIDVLVEAIGGTTTARTLIETTLRRGEDAKDKLRVLAWLAFVGDPPLIAPTSRTNRL